MLDANIDRLIQNMKTELNKIAFDVDIILTCSMCSKVNTAFPFELDFLFQNSGDLTKKKI